MERTMWNRKLLAVVLGIGFLSFQAAVPAAGDDSEEWRAERRMLYERIDKEVDQELARIANPRAIAKALGMEYPVPRSPNGYAEIMAEVEEKVDDAVDLRFPASEVAGFQQEAEERYRMYEIGDRVSFVLRGGFGTNTSVEGVFRRINQNRIQIGSRWVPTSDMDDEDLARFSPELHEEMVAKYVESRKNHRELDIEKFREQLTLKLAYEHFTKNNYVYRGDRWLSKRDYLDRIVEYQIEVKEPQIRERVEQRIFRQNEYTQYEDEWMPKSEARQLAAEAKILAERKKQEEEERESMNSMPGMGGMMPGMGGGGMMPGMPSMGGGMMPGMPSMGGGGSGGGGGGMMPMMPTMPGAGGGSMAP
jgi:hypothetical protein